MDEVNELQVTSKKTITATFNRNSDTDILKKYNRLVAAGFGPRDIVEVGISGLLKGERYQQWLKEVGEDMVVHYESEEEPTV